MLQGTDILFEFRTGDETLADLVDTTPRQDLIDRLGFKGYNLARMAAMGIEVPEGFTLTTRAADDIIRFNRGVLESYTSGELPFSQLVDVTRFPPAVDTALDDALDRIEADTGRRFGDPERPLLVSVRTGATVSMPGVLDTLCNIGFSEPMLNENAPFWVWDSYGKFLETYGELVAGVPPEGFEEIRQRQEARTFGSLKARVKAYRDLYAVPKDARTVIRRTVRALLLTAQGEKTLEYRRQNYIAGDLNLGITVQRMVFGNFDDRSAAGVVFTRDPSTGLPIRDSEGRRRLLGQVRLGGQGNDVVSDLAVVEPLHVLEARFPDICRRLEDIFFDLESVEGCVQDGEFTVENGHLWVLQARPAKMSPQGTLASVVDMVDEGKVSQKQALSLVGARQLEKTLYSREKPVAVSELERIGGGKALVPGVTGGHIVFSHAAAERFKNRNEMVILVRERLLNEDIPHFESVDGLLSQQKNVTSHATLVARAAGNPAIIETDLAVNGRDKTLTFINRNMDEVTLPEGTYITLDATRGAVYRGWAPLQGTDLNNPDLQRFIEFLNQEPTLTVYTQTEDPESFEVARKLGTDGLGYFRSDVMFFKKPINFALCSYLMAPAGKGGPDLTDLTDRMVEEYLNLFRFCGGFVGIRLIKHTMREYFPTASFEVRMLAEHLMRKDGVDPEKHPKDVDRRIRAIHQKRNSLEDYNPIMGMRGARLATAFPQVYEAHLRALFRAGRRARGEGMSIRLDLLVPYLTLVKEFVFIKDLAGRIAAEELEGETFPWRMVPVIEVSGIALEAGELARHAEKIVIRSDKLTTSSHHLVREDAHAFLGEYIEREWFHGDPFRIIQTSTEKLVTTAIEAARSVNPNVIVMIAGDHCSNEYSLRRLLHLGISEVAAPPRMVPLVKLMAINLERVGVLPPVPREDLRAAQKEPVPRTADRAPEVRKAEGWPGSGFEEVL